MSYSYRLTGGEIVALKDVTFSLQPGEVLAVVGANGSGKSTLVRMSNGLLLAESGSVTIEGLSTSDSSALHRIRELVGLVFQHPDDQIVATSVEDDVAFGPENLGLPPTEIRRRVDDALTAVGLTRLGSKEPHLLSGGQKQRLVIAGALAMRPRYLVMDEPTSMLDPQGRREVLELIGTLKAQGHGVLLVTHDLAEAATADRVIVLAQGAIAFEGTSEDLLGRPDLDSWGLELPPVTALASALFEMGVPVNRTETSPAIIAEALCR